jgi:hypothetical protein
MRSMRTNGRLCLERLGDQADTYSEQRLIKAQTKPAAIEPVVLTWCRLPLISPRPWSSHYPNSPEVVRRLPRGPVLFPRGFYTNRLIDPSP